MAHKYLHLLPLLLAALHTSSAVANVPEAPVSSAAPARYLTGQTLLEMAADVEVAELVGRARQVRGTSIPLSEYRRFSGIGAVVCTVDGKQRASTAFLVGRFDVAVTVAHTFEFKHRQAQPEECQYVGTGPIGQIRERIGIASIKSQWRLQPEKFGRPDCDLAVIRLHSPVQVAQTTLPFTKFAHNGARVALVGFSREIGADPLKRRLRANVYRRPGKNCVKFAHDLASLEISSGAPVIDRRDGIVIGIHNDLGRTAAGAGPACADRGNAMLLMNEWLERTLRAEIGL